MTEKSNQTLEIFSSLLRNPIIFTLMNPHRRTHHKNNVAPAGQMRIIHLLNQEGELSVGDISEFLDIRPSSATVLIDKLIEKGLVERKIDKQDRRYKVIKLTKLGEQLISDSVDARDELSEEIFSGLTSKELTEFDRMLEIINDNVKDIDFGDYMKRQVYDSFDDRFGRSGFRFRK